VVLLLVGVVVKLPNVQELPSVVAQLNDLATPLAITLTIIVAYTLGLVLGQVYGGTVGKLLEGRDRKIERECQQACFVEHMRTLDALGKKAPQIDGARLPRTFVMHDQLRLVAPTETPRLLKVRAERRMAEVIVLGTSLLAVANTAILAAGYSTYRLVLSAALLLTAVGAWRSAGRRLTNFTNGTTIMWLMHATRGPFPLPRLQHSDRDSNGAA
jgi:hypothetical protein